MHIIIDILFANYLYIVCVTQRFELFQRKALYKYVLLLLLLYNQSVLSTTFSLV